jgi:hypothetical protein
MITIHRKQELTERVNKLKQNSVVLTPAQREQMKKKFATNRDAWVKRRRQCLDAVGSISDAMEKKPAEIEKLIGIETDEMCGVVLPPASLNKPVAGSRINIVRRPLPVGKLKK